MTWQDAADLDRATAVFILPVGATEAHGPHLPLGTDVVIAEAMARAGAERLAARGLEPVLLPPLCYTAAPFAAGFAGTISMRAETVTFLVGDIARSLAAHGFRTLALANAHLDPEHLGALHAAAKRLAGSETTLVFPDITRRPWGSRLTDEFKSGACHAGRYEGSILLAARPELVRGEVARGLPEVATSLATAYGEGKRTFEQAGGELAYFGAPAAATAEEGRESIAVLGAILEEAVLAALPGDD